jgi:hypothetical protein
MLRIKSVPPYIISAALAFALGCVICLSTLETVRAEMTRQREEYEAAVRIAVDNAVARRDAEMRKVFRARDGQK